MKNKPYSGKGTNFYKASKIVADTVNLAIDLGRPLLVEGEPGCGKTMLAYSIASEKGLGDPIKISVKSTSRARDLLYFFDGLGRLQDAQGLDTMVKPRYEYVSLGLLGKAIHDQIPCLVLIDEIDKADIDFPNDLLDVLDTFTFEIEYLADVSPEVIKQREEKHKFGYRVHPHKQVRPIVIITSNREKQLPEPFLRRCLYVHLEFPEAFDDLAEIVRMNITRGQTQWRPRTLNDEVLSAAIKAFLEVRRLAVDSEVQKPPTTSELIDWVMILHRKRQTEASIAKKGYYPPYWELLFKAKQDLDAYDKLAKAETEKDKREKAKREKAAEQKTPSKEAE